MSKKTDSKVIAESVNENVAAIPETEGVELMATAKKIGVVRYLQDHPQEPYIETLMKKKYAMQAKTIAQWDEIAASMATIKY